MYIYYGYVCGREDKALLRKNVVDGSPLGRMSVNFTLRRCETYTKNKVK